MATTGGRAAPVLCPRVARGCCETPGMQGRGWRPARAPRTLPEPLGDNEGQPPVWLRVSHIILEGVEEYQCPKREPFFEGR